MEGFIKIHRRLLEWEWSDNPNVLSAFLHCLILANWEDKKWRGNTVKRGSFVTSISKFAAVTGLSVRQTRTAFDKLQATNEINVIGTTQFTVIEVVKYDKYQGLNTDDDKRMTNERQANGQTDDKQMTTTKNSKKSKNNKNNNNTETSSVLPDKSGSRRLKPFPYNDFYEAWAIGYEQVTGKECRNRFTDDIKTKVQTIRRSGYTVEDCFYAMKMLLLEGQKGEYHARVKWRNFTLLHLFTQANFIRYVQKIESDFENSGLSPIFEQAMKNLGL